MCTWCWCVGCLNVKKSRSSSAHLLVCVSARETTCESVCIYIIINGTTPVSTVVCFNRILTSSTPGPEQTPNTIPQSNNQRRRHRAGLELFRRRVECAKANQPTICIGQHHITQIEEISEYVGLWTCALDTYAGIEADMWLVSGRYAFVALFG